MECGGWDDIMFMHQRYDYHHRSCPEYKRLKAMHKGKDRVMMMEPVVYITDRMRATMARIMSSDAMAPEYVDDIVIHYQKGE
jgi:hypothetical protein